MSNEAFSLISLPSGGLVTCFLRLLCSCLSLPFVLSFSRPRLAISSNIYKLDIPWQPCFHQSSSWHHFLSHPRGRPTIGRPHAIPAYVNMVRIPFSLPPSTEIKCVLFRSTRNEQLCIWDAQNCTLLHISASIAIDVLFLSCISGPPTLPRYQISHLPQAGRSWDARQTCWSKKSGWCARVAAIVRICIAIARRARWGRLSGFPRMCVLRPFWTFRTHVDNALFFAKLSVERGHLLLSLTCTCPKTNRCLHRCPEEQLGATRRCRGFRFRQNSLVSVLRELFSRSRICIVDLMKCDMYQDRRAQ
jgi:hypothetical protein